MQKRAAELLKIKPTTLNEMIKRYDIRPRRKKASAAGAAADGLPVDEEVGATHASPLLPVGSDVE